MKTATRLRRPPIRITPGRKPRKEWDLYSAFHEIGHAIVIRQACSSFRKFERNLPYLDGFACESRTKKEAYENVSELWCGLATKLAGAIGESLMMGTARTCCSETDFPEALSIIDALIAIGEMDVDITINMEGLSEIKLGQDVWNAINPTVKLTPERLRILDQGFRLAARIIYENRWVMLIACEMTMQGRWRHNILTRRQLEMSFALAAIMPPL